MSVPLVRFPHLWIQHGMTGHDPRRVVPLGNLGVLAWLAARPSFSQLPHVLLRLLAPKHPPHTLCSLTMFSHGPPFILALLRIAYFSSKWPAFADPRPTPPLVKELSALPREEAPPRRSGDRTAGEESLTARPPSRAGRASVRRSVVEMTGIEPATSALQRRRSPS